MNNLRFNEVVDKLHRVNVLKGVIAHSGLGKIGESVQSLFIRFIVLVLDGEAFGLSHTRRVHELNLNLAKLLIVGHIVNAEHISSLRDKSETTRHRDSCHVIYPP